MECQPVDDESLSLSFHIASVYHFHHYFRYASLLFFSTPDSKLTFSINSSHRSVFHLFRLISQILGPFPDLINSLFLFCFVLSLLFFND